MVEINNITSRGAQKNIITDLSFDISDGEITGITGPHDSGKSTLLEIIAGRSRCSGSVILNGADISSFKGRELQRSIAISARDTPQNMHEIVEHFLLLSRLPFRERLRTFSGLDRQVVQEIIEEFDLTLYRDRQLATLPNSLMRMVITAFAATRQAPLLCLDDPTASLDLHYRAVLQRAIHRYTSDGKRMAVISSNDINFLCQCADTIIILHEGSAVFRGDPGDLTQEIIERYFGVNVITTRNVYNGRPVFHMFPDQ